MTGLPLRLRSQPRATRTDMSTEVAIPDAVIVTAFDRGRAMGRQGTKYGRTQCPYGPSKPEQQEAWFCGYDFGMKEH